jgi:hypothetical protein
MNKIQTATAAPGGGGGRTHALTYIYIHIQATLQAIFVFSDIDNV